MPWECEHPGRGSPGVVAIDADSGVQCLLKFRKLVFELPEKVLTLNASSAPVRADIAIKDLTVMESP